MIGQTISHYKITAKLGEGAMGVVYKAEDTKLERTVALKFLAAHLLKDEEARKRFNREAKAAAALSHPNICRVYEIDEVEGRSFIAMEFVEGESLDRRIDQGPLKIPDALGIGQQIAEALQAAHEKDVVHRDIKPANIIVDDKGHVTVLDFGLALLTEGSKLTQLDTTLGTIAYMSPEQAQGARVDHRTDIWALGCVLYEMICGQRPFKGLYDKALLYEIVHEEPDALTGVRTGVPTELEFLVNKCLAKDTANRYQSAGEMIVDLRNLREKLKSAKSAVVSVAAAQGVADVGAASDGQEQHAGPVRKVLLGVAAAAVVAVALFVGRGSVEAPVAPVPSELPPSVAIMPFVNSSGDPDFEYFSDGMTDELINALSKVDGLKVAARSSVFRFKGERYDVKEVASTLGVANIVEGTVRRDGERLRITTQLINASDGFELWSERFDRRMEAVFDIQDEVSRSIAERLQVKLAGGSEPAPLKRPTANVEAYNLCLRGEFEYFKLSREGTEKSVDYLEQARRLDPSFARAHAGLARAYTNLAMFGALPVAEIAQKARDLASRALQLDDSEGRAHAASAYISRFIEWNWEAADTSYQRALTLNQADAETRSSYGIFLATMGRLTDAVAQGERALQTDPLSASVNRRLAYIYLQARRYEDSLRQAQHTLDLAPDYVSAYWDMAGALIGLGRLDEALEVTERGGSLAPDNPSYRWFSGYVYGRAGRQPEALAIAQQLERRRTTEYVPALMIANVYVGTGDWDSAIRWMDVAFNEREPQLAQISSFPIYDPIRSDPRFQDLLRRMNFPK